MWNCSLNSFTIVGSTVMVKTEKKDDWFEEIIEEASEIAREFQGKKLHLKSMGIDVDNKERSEIENLYRLYETTVLYNGC